MRVYSSLYNQKNTDLRKEVRWTIEVSFDTANTDLYYFTSHKDCEVPPGTAEANVFYSLVKKPVITSQKLDTRNTKFTIGSITFDLIDKDSAVTNLLKSKIDGGDGLRRKRVRVYRGYAGLLWADYHVPPGGTQIVDGKVSYNNGVYTIRCNDIQRSTKKDIFDLKKTNLAASYTKGDTTITVSPNGTNEFEMVAHGASFSESPDTTVGYIKIKDNVIRYTWKTSNTFTGCVGGMFNSVDVSIPIDTSTPTPKAERQPEVEEFVYLEMPAPKLAKALLMGTNPTLPDHWHLGIDPSFVDTAQFDNIGVDLYDTADDTLGFRLRFDGIEKIDGKKFIQEQVNLPVGCFMPVMSSGKLGYKRMSAVLSGASPVAVLNASNVISYSALDHDNSQVANKYIIHWNKVVGKEKATRTNVFIDPTSIANHQQSNPIELTFDGLHGDWHSDAIIRDRFDSLRDRYSGPPELITVKCLDSLNGIEIGDIVRCDFDQRDFVGGGGLNRAFEVIGYKSSGNDVTLDLFGSSQKPGFIVADASLATVLQDSFYSTSVGLLDANKFSAATTGSGTVWHVTGDSTFDGGADMTANAAILWYDGDVVIDFGATLTLKNNVQLRVMGHLTVNGKINMSGQGLPGTAAEAAGTAGWIGNTKAGAGWDGNRIISREWGVDINSTDYYTRQATTTEGLNSETYRFALTNNGTSLDGLSVDMRPSSGGGGMNIVINKQGIGGPSVDVVATGGAGGSGGSACVCICRSFSVGGSGQILMDGGVGQLGGSYTTSNLVGTSTPLRTLLAGHGATGSPGVFYLLIDGSSSTIPSIAEFTANMPSPSFVGSPSRNETPLLHDDTEDWPLYNRNLGLFGDNMADTMYEYWSLTAQENAAGDIDIGPLSPPTGLSVASGTAQLLRQADGTIVARALVSWVESQDVRVIGYDVRFKKTIDTVYIPNPRVDGRSTVQAYVIDVSSNEAWDFGVRSVSEDGTGEWVDITNQMIAGKQEPPPGADSFLFTRQPDGTREFTFDLLIKPLDFAGYLIRYRQGTWTSWDDLYPLHQGILTSSPYETNALPAGSYTFAIKTVDTSNIKSADGTDLFITSTLGNPRIPGSLLTEDPGIQEWPGTLTSCYTNGLGLSADGSDTWTSMPATWTLWGSHWNSNPSTSFTYEHTEIDIGSIATFTPLVSVVTGSNPTIQERHKNASGDAWSAYATAGTLITARYVQIKVTIAQATSEVPAMDSMFINFSAEPIEEDLNDVDTSTLTGAYDLGVGDIRLPIVKTYTVITRVELAIQGTGGGWTWKLMDRDVTTGPRVLIYNATPALADATIDAYIKGV